MTKMEVFLLVSTLEEHAERLQKALQGAQEELNATAEPVKVRQWNEKAGIRIFAPKEDDSPELWHWQDTYPAHPALAGISDAIDHLTEFIEKVPFDSTD